MIYKARENSQPSRTINYKAIFKGSLYAFYLVLFLGVSMGSIMYYSNVSEGWLSFLTSIIFVVVIFFGGLIAAKKAGYMGLYHGLGVGVIITAFALFLNLIFIAEGITAAIFIKKLIYSLVAGGLGGIAGVAFGK